MVSLIMTKLFVAHAKGSAKRLALEPDPSKADQFEKPRTPPQHLRGPFRQSSLPRCVVGNIRARLHVETGVATTPLGLRALVVPVDERSQLGLAFTRPCCCVVPILKTACEALGLFGPLAKNFGKCFLKSLSTFQERN